MRAITLIVCVAAALCVFRATGNGAIVIADPLTGAGNLNGTAPATDTYNPADTWTSYNTNFTRSSAGTVIGANGVGGPGTGGNPGASAGSLAFAPVSGNIYFASRNIHPGAGSNGDWLFLGFGPAKLSVFVDLGTPGPWMLIRTSNGFGQNAGDLQVFSSNAIPAGNFTGANSGVTGTTQSLKIVLDTTHTAWTASYYENNTFLTSYTYPTNPITISSVNFGQYFTAAGTGSNFLLTATPEPGSLCILGLVVMGLLARRHNSPSMC